jgi:hypothetical protein
MKKPGGVKRGKKLENIVGTFNPKGRMRASTPAKGAGPTKRTGLFVTGRVSVRLVPGGRPKQ